MRLNSTQLSLPLGLYSLETTVLPDATSDAARNAIANICLTLTDLLKREGPAIPFLQKIIGDGETLYRLCREVLGSKTITSPVTRTDNSVSFDFLVTKHSDLTERLNGIAMQLAEASPSNLEAAAALRTVAEWEQSYYVGLQKLQISPFGNDAFPPPLSQPPLIAEYLESFLRTRREGSSLQITDFVSIHGGYGNQTFSCIVKSEGKEDEKIFVRKSDGVPIVLCLEQEYDLLRTLSSADIPVAKARELASNLPGVDGTFYTMNRIPGGMAGSYVDGTKIKFSEKMLLGLAELLGKLHSIPLENLHEYITKYREDSVLHENNQERNHRNFFTGKNTPRKLTTPLLHTSSGSSAG